MKKSYTLKKYKALKDIKYAPDGMGYIIIDLKKGKEYELYSKFADKCSFLELIKPPVEKKVKKDTEADNKKEKGKKVKEKGA